MKLESQKMLYRWYRNNNIILLDEVLEKRYNGIQHVIDIIEEIGDVTKLIKIWLKLDEISGFEKEFTDCFSEADMEYEADNKIENSILAGMILFDLLDTEFSSYISFMIHILKPYYTIDQKELIEKAIIKMKEQTKEVCKSNVHQNSILKIEKQDIDDYIGTDKKFTIGAPEIIVDTFNALIMNIEDLNQKNGELIIENQKAYEKIQILSWIIGEYSDYLENNLPKVQDINGAFVLGAELANLVLVKPGPYAAEAFILKMLTKCKKSIYKTGVTLTDFIDNQNESIKKYILEKHSDNLSERIRPIFSAIKASLTVDEKKVWVHAYKKAYGINPDEIKLGLSEWAMLIYMECMVVKF